MSVIVSKSNRRVTSYSCFPAIAEQHIIPVGGTILIDSLPTSVFTAGKWIITVGTTTGDRLRGYELYATHRKGVSPTSVLYADVGDVIDHIINVVINGSSLTLSVTNNETEDLLFCFTRTAIPTTRSYQVTQTIVEIGNVNSFVLPNSAQAVDFVTAHTALGIKWIVTLSTEGGDRASSQVFTTSANTAQYVQYGDIGDMWTNVDLSVELVGDFGYQLIVHNNGSLPVRVDVTRIPIQVGSTVNYCGPSAGLDLWLPSVVQINAGQTQVVDTQLPTSVYASVKWLVSVSSATKTMTFEYTATPAGSITLDNMYSIIGDYMNIVVTSSLTNNIVSLNVQNNESVSLISNLLRIPVAL